MPFGPLTQDDKACILKARETIAQVKKYFDNQYLHLNGTDWYSSTVDQIQFYSSFWNTEAGKSSNEVKTTFTRFNNWVTLEFSQISISATLASEVAKLEI